VSVGGPRAHSVFFTNDAAGQVIERRVTGGPDAVTPHQYYYYYNGIQIGASGNNGNDAPDLATSISERIAPPRDEAAIGIFRNGTDTQSPFADFDQAYEAVTTSSLGAGPGSYTVRAGETLSTIAATLWGDASLWYKLAEANGLSGGNSISAGQTLTIPNTLSNFHNTADTFRPYDANSALGDVQPGTPKPPKAKSCGIVGTILLVVVAAVVAAYVGPWVSGLATSVLGTGAAASVAAGAIGAAAGAAAATATTQALEVIGGYRDKISWKQVALDGIEAGVSFGLSKVIPAGSTKLGKLASKVVRAALANAITQGIGTATGLKDKFDWTGVAVAGAAAAGAELAGALKISSAFLKGLVQTAAGAIAGAAARSLIEGSDFGDNVLAALPSAIAATLTNALLDEIESADAPEPVKETEGPQAGREGTPNAAANTAVKRAEASATDQGQLGDIIVHANLGALAFGPSRELQDELISPVELGAGLDPETWDGEFGYRSLFDGIQLADAGGRIPGGSVSDVNPRSYFQGSPDGPSLDIKIPSLDVLAKEAVSTTSLPPFGWKDLASPRKWPLVLLVTPSAAGSEEAIPLHGTKIMITHQGDTTSTSWPLKVDGKPIGGSAIETTLPNVFAIMDDSGKPRTIKGANAIVMMSIPDSEQRIGVGVIIRTRREAEIYNEGIAGGWDSNKINAAIDTERTKSGAGDGSFRIGDMRRVPGRVFASGKLVKAGKGWLSSGSAAIPKQVLDKLKGQRLNSGSDLTRAIWKAVADTPELAKDFGQADLWRMQHDRSPRVTKADQHRGQRTWIVHHQNDIQFGGPVYDLSNLRIVTPKEHYRIHYGKK
jgi:LysM repeat protein